MTYMAFILEIIGNVAGVIAMIAAVVAIEIGQPVPTQTRAPIVMVAPSATAEPPTATPVARPTVPPRPPRRLPPG